MKQKQIVIAFIHTYIHTQKIIVSLLLYSGLHAILSDSVEMGEDTYRETSITSFHVHT